MARQPVTKPAPTDHEWFQGGAGANKATPANGQIDTGYVPPGVIPKLEEFNFWMQKWDQLTRYYIQRGLPDWDAGETYQAGDIVRYSGEFYVAIAPVLASVPTTNLDLSSRQWVRMFRDPFGTDESATDDTPIFGWRNARSLIANQIDRLGFVSGPRVQQWMETWKGSDGQLVTGAKTLSDTSQQWVCNVVRTGSGGVNQTIGTGFSGLTRCLFLGIGTGGSDVAEIQSNQASIFSDSHGMALELRVNLAANVDLQRTSFGLIDASTGDLYGDTNAFKGLVITKGNGDTNWQVITGDGAARTTTASAIAAAANGDFIFRLEWISSTMAKDTVKQARAYINGTRVGRHTTNLPANGTACSVGLAVKRDTGAAARSCYVSPVRFSMRY